MSLHEYRASQMNRYCIDKVKLANSLNSCALHVSFSPCCCHEFAMLCSIRMAILPMIQSILPKELITMDIGKVVTAVPQSKKPINETVHHKIDF